MTMNVDISSLEEDLEDIDDLFNCLPRPRILRTRQDVLENYSEIEFKMRYRMNKATVMTLVEMFATELDPVTNRTQPIYAAEQVLLTLRYYATGGFQMTLGDLFGVHQVTAGAIVHRVTKLIASLRPHVVKVPDSDTERENVKKEFYNIAGFPGVLAAVDCTHVKIKSPTRIIGEKYRNRKGWFSYNVQSACDSNLRAMDVVARWAGSSHDMTVFDNSLLRIQMEAGEFGNGVLLGDGGYACRKYLLTPIGSPQTEAQKKYNDAQIATRNPIERMFGVLKRRFPCLAVGMQLNKENILAVIVATFVLHNIAIDNRDTVPEADPEVAVPLSAYDIIHIPYDGVQNNFVVRNAVIAGHFS